MKLILHAQIAIHYITNVAFCMQALNDIIHKSYNYA